MKLEKAMEKLIASQRIDAILSVLMKIVPWNKLLLAFSNVCVHRANAYNKKKPEYKEWMKRAKLFHKTMEDEETKPDSVV